MNMDKSGVKHPGETPDQLDLRIVLLGPNGAGKSSTANTILGQSEFDTLQRTAVCVRRQGTIAGTQVTVVDTPGWPAEVTLDESLKQTKREIQFSASLCLPGPHCFLLAIQANVTFTDMHRNAIQQHLELLSESIWSHAIVLFTYRHFARKTTIEQHIKHSGQPLQWVIEKCGNRYHVISHENNDFSQVTELLDKIKAMVVFNGGSLFEVDSKRSQEITKRRKQQERRAAERQIRVYKQHFTLKYVIGGDCHLSELRIVLLGYEKALKSTSGNSILEREEFDTTRRTALCVKKQGTVAGTKAIIVDTPGWRNWDNLKDSPELTKQEILYSLSLCQPGPHAFLLAVRLDVSFTEDSRRSIQQHLEQISESVWDHTIVFFTNGKYLGDTTIEQHIESEGKSLQWLVEKCKDRYVVDCENIGNGTLVEKIENVLAATISCHYEMDMERLLEIEERRRQQEEEAKMRRMKVQKQRVMLRSPMGYKHQSELRLVLLGSKYAGKSMSGNSILCSKKFGTTGPTVACVKRQGLVAGRELTVVDTPGWWADHTLAQSDGMTTNQIVLSVFLCSPGPHVLLLVVRLTTAFTDAHRVAFQQHLEQIDPLIWKYTMVLFTCGDHLGDATIEQHIESEGEALKWLVEKCGNRYHVLNNTNAEKQAQVIELLEKVEETLSRRTCYHVEKNRVCGGVLRREVENELGESGKSDEAQEDREMLGSKVGQIPQVFVKERWLQKSKKIRKGRSLPFLLKRKNVNKQSSPMTQDQVTENRDDTEGMQPLQDKMEDTDLTARWLSLSEINQDDTSEVTSLISSGYQTLVSYKGRHSPTSKRLSRQSDISSLRSKSTVDLESIEEQWVCFEEESQNQSISDDDDDHDEMGSRRGNCCNSEDERLDISDDENHKRSDQSCCKYCANNTDSFHWVLLEPVVSMETGFQVYKHSSPSGSFECAVSGLRWVCTGKISLQYHFSDPDVFRAELAMLQYTPIGPLMDIKVLSGELQEVHLPHFACLEGSLSTLGEAVRVLRSVDCNVTLETCELTRFHAKLLKPSFSLTEVLVKMGIPVKTHLDVLIYRTRVTPLTLLIYVVPRDASMIQAVKEEAEETPGAKKIQKHRPDVSIRMNTKFSLRTSCPADISPTEITLKYLRPPDLFEVFMETAENCFDLEVMSKGQSIWKATMRSVEYGETGHKTQSHEESEGASGHSQGAAHRQKSGQSRAPRAEEEASKMASVSNKERLFMFRPGLIKRTSRCLLRDVLDRLQVQPSVITSREAEEVLQRTSVLQDQVTSLIDMVLKKGEKACDVLLSLVEEMDIYLYQDLCL